LAAAEVPARDRATGLTGRGGNGDGRPSLGWPPPRDGPVPCAL